MAGATYTFRKSVLEDLPEAGAFLQGVLARGSVAPPTAAHYVKVVARLKKQGRLNDVDLLTHNVERTAANAYWRWCGEHYDARIKPLQTALPIFNRDALRWLRRHALVPPAPGKLIPRVMLGTAGSIEWVPSASWTLHVPERAEAVHVDPCPTCTAIELTDAQVALIADAFESAWGHRELARVPSAALLFGDPPPIAKATKTSAPPEKAVALVGPGVTADALGGVNARVTRDVSSFFDRLREGADGVYLSREACNGKLGEVLAAVQSAWGP